jgi:MFS family permease
VLRRITDRNIWLVYGATLAVGLAYGIAISILAIFLDDKGYDPADIGSLAVWFALGIAALAIPTGSLIRRYSARATLIAALAGYAFSITLFPYVAHNFALVAAVRFVDGACSVGIWISCETILLSRADARHKAFVTSLYAIAIALGYIVGPLCARLIVSLYPLHSAFVIAGVIAIGTAALVWWRLDPDVPIETKPGQSPTHETSYASLCWNIKTSLFGTFAYGYFQASVVLFLPLYLIAAKGVEREQTIIIPAFFALGMLVFTNFAGRLGDRFGHLLLMRVLSFVGMFTVLGFVWLDAFAAMAVAVFVAGATLASISPVSLALQGVIAEPRDYARATAVYNAFYAAGMLAGPPASGMLLKTSGGPLMLYHLAALWGAFCLFTVLFARDDPATEPRGARRAGQQT